VQNITVKYLTITLLISFLLHSQPAVANKEITLATAERIPYIGKNLPQRGYIHELAKVIFENAGYQVNINFYPLARSRYLLQTGKIDGMLPAYYDAELTNTVAYSAPFSGDKIGLLKRKTLQLPTDYSPRDDVVRLLEKLRNYRFGVVRGAAISPLFDQENSISKQYVTTDINNIDMLNLARVDLITIDRYTAADIMVRHRPHLIGELEFLPNFLSQNNFHIAFSKKSVKYRQYQTDFNQSLRELRLDGTIERILNKHGVFSPPQQQAEKITLTIGTVNNDDMLIMQSLSNQFEQQHHDIEIKWRVLDENTLRQRLLSDLAISDGQFDIMTIGAYETLIWAKNNWLEPLVDFGPQFDLHDIFPAIKNTLSYQGSLYASPFYGESSITYYRKDLFNNAHLRMPENPTYNEIREFAATLHNPDKDIYGICLRGKPGWGENIALLSTMVNTYQGQWFNNNWQPQLNSSAWHQALAMYDDLLRNYGPPKPTLNGYNENKTLFSNGHCAIWIDATVAAGTLFNPLKSKVFAKVALTSAPVATTNIGSKWLWTWALAIPKSSKHKAAAMKFITWATSKQYIKTVAQRVGWLAIPPGTRRSTYDNENYQAVAPFANIVLSAIEAASNNNLASSAKNYTGIQFVEIPEFPAIGHQVGLNIARVIEGDLSIKECLILSQKLADEQMKASKYY